MLTVKKEYTDIDKLNKSGKYPDSKMSICIKSYGQKHRKDISYFVYVTDCSLEKEFFHNEKELILIDLGAGKILFLRIGDRVKFEKYGFVVYHRIYINEIPSVSVIRFIMHKGSPAARINDYQMQQSRRIEEWEHLYTEGCNENTGME